nr:peptidoglycan editing factor PgeF [Neobacillus sp. Marseille-Q6967]
MEPFVQNDELFLSIEKWEKQYPGLTAGITTKNGGKSNGIYATFNMGFHVGDMKEDVCLNRQRLAEELHFPLLHWVGAEQTHDVRIERVNRSNRGKGADTYSDAYKGTDGFYTDEEGILLTLCYADCVPLFFLSPTHHMIGAAHAGWKGTVNEIARYMVEAWQTEGINPNEIYIVIGPSICKKCYIVNDYVINFVENILVDVEKKPYNLIKEGQYCLDLREVNKQILMKAGVPAANIQISKLCSSCHEELFFSHRRDQGKTGRMLSYIGWKETEK